MSRESKVLTVLGVIIVVVIMGGVLVMHARSGHQLSSNGVPVPANNQGIHKIQHVIVIMQENRSFDSYFGTYPGADGIPMKNGVPTVCAPNPLNGQCIKPFVDHSDLNIGGPIGAADAVADVDGGKMDGFIKQQLYGTVGGGFCNPQSNFYDKTKCNAVMNGAEPDSMGYHTQSDIPNYWSYAQHFTLMDHMFESVASWSSPSHLYMVSGWSAACKPGDTNPKDCTNDIVQPETLKNAGKSGYNPNYDWTDITYLLNKYHVSWNYYLDQTTDPLNWTPYNLKKTTNTVPSIWNPMPWFTTVQNDAQLNNIQLLSNFFKQAKAGTLPNVSWIIPNQKDSEHEPALVSDGQSYVTNIVNAVMQSPDWNSTAIIIAWDDWGGFYDNAVPPKVDQNGYGLRVPAILISPYAKPGYIDHQTQSFDGILKFIEDDFMGGQRLNPATDGRPDARPDVRENSPYAGNLINDFDFNQKPIQPLILPVHPQTTLTSTNDQAATLPSLPHYAG